MSVTFSETGNSVIIKIDGVFGFSKAKDFTKAYQGFERGAKMFAVDLESTSYMESYGVGMLLSLKEYCKPECMVKLLNANDTIIAILKQAQLQDMFEVVPQS